MLSVQNADCILHVLCKDAPFSYNCIITLVMTHQPVIKEHDEYEFVINLTCLCNTQTSEKGKAEACKFGMKTQLVDCLRHVN